MAAPTQTNIAITNIQAPTDGTPLPALTAYVCFSPGIGGVTKTCNLTSDTIIYRGDGSIWDDTQGAWISPDITSRRPTPRNQDGH